MNRSLLVAAFLALVCGAIFLPIRTTPPILLSSADGTAWKCSKSALIMTTCAPDRGVHLASFN